MTSPLREKIRESEYGDSPNNFHIRRHGDTLLVELTYPKISENGVTKIFIDQESVRATDGIRLSYDYDRDGWIIEQQSRFAWRADDKVFDPDWQEVAFIESWAREETEEETAARLEQES
jgi:hypothetical protein